MTLNFEEARRTILDRVRAGAARPSVETAGLTEAAGRVLAQPVLADRDLPALSRSARDGFAVRAVDVPGRLRLVGEVRAGAAADRALQPGEAIEIMTGAPMPEGADAVVMVEYSKRDGEFLELSRGAQSGENFNTRGCDARAGRQALAAGHLLDYTSAGLLATFGVTRVSVYARPTVAILATGDEIVEPHETPAPHQIRNSNAYSLAAQVTRAGGIPRILPVARDNYDSTRSLIEQGLESDLLLMSGGVSAGKYDIVEQVLAELGAEFYFTRVKVQPGQPLVFGSARGKFFFGLPGNPASTIVTFEVFARVALELLSGIAEPRTVLAWAKLTDEFRHKAGLTRFLPAMLSDSGDLTPLKWSGSADIGALARSNAFLVASADLEFYPAGGWIQFLRK